MLRIDDGNRKWWIVVASGAVGGLILLDETVIGVALPTVQRDLGMAQVAAHWVMNAYLLVFAGLAAAGGRLGDVVGTRTAFLAGLAIFGLASLAAGAAQDGAWLVAARAVQGVGAAVIFPASLAMVTLVFPEEQRGMALGACAAIGTAFLAAGPLVGGFFTELLSWRWIFWLNAPLVSLVALVFAAAWVEPARAGPRLPFDWRGLAALAAGLGLLVFAVMQGGAWGWTRPVIVLALVGSVAALALFVRIERRRPTPLIDVGMFRNATFAACNLVLFAGQFSKIIVVVFVALYLQHGLLMSPLTAGLALLVAVVGTPLMAAPVGRLADRYGARGPTLGGLALTALGMAWVGLAAGTDGYALLAPGLVLWGVALPFCFMPPLRAVMGAVPKAQQGAAGGISMTSRLLGATIGMAAGSTLLAATGSYRIVFLATACLALAVLLIGWFAIARPSAARTA